MDSLTVYPLFSFFLNIFLCFRQIAAQLVQTATLVRPIQIMKSEGITAAIRDVRRQLTLGTGLLTLFQTVKAMWGNVLSVWLASYDLSMGTAFFCTVSFTCCAYLAKFWLQPLAKNGVRTL